MQKYNGMTVIDIVYFLPKNLKSILFVNKNNKQKHIAVKMTNHFETFSLIKHTMSYILTMKPVGPQAGLRLAQAMILKPLHR